MSRQNAIMFLIFQREFSSKGQFNSFACKGLILVGECLANFIVNSIESTKLKKKVDPIKENLIGLCWFKCIILLIEFEVLSV